MNKKILGIFACLLLLATALSVMGANDNEIKVINNVANEKGGASFFEIQEDTSKIKLNNPKNTLTFPMDQLDQE